jgi:hypothetical protein
MFFRKTSAIAILLALVSSLMLCWLLPCVSAPVDFKSEQFDSLSIVFPERQLQARDEQSSSGDLASHLHDDYVLRYPLMYWREWSNQKLPPLRVLVFMLILVTAVQLLFGTQSESARVVYDQKRLRMFGIGALISVLGCVVAGFLYRLGLFAPLAGLLIALVQLINLFGLTVAAQSIGIGFLKLLKLEQWQQSSKQGLLVRAWAGAFLLSLIALIPRIGALPPLAGR